jgi:hypothetical protein
MSAEKTRLDGWKAVAAHIGRSERTVHRWAKERGLPVYHVAGGGSVFAWAEELDAWFLRVRDEPDAGDEPPVVATVVSASPARVGTRWLGLAGLAVALLLIAAVVVVRGGLLAQPRGAASAPTVVGAGMAVQYAGRTITVCGVVASASYAQDSRGMPTFLNFDKPYPKQEFMVVIWGTNRSKFGTPELTLVNKRVCATGQVEVYRGVAEIEVVTPSALQVSR